MNTQTLSLNTPLKEIVGNPSWGSSNTEHSPSNATPAPRSGEIRFDTSNVSSKANTDPLQSIRAILQTEIAKYPPSNLADRLNHLLTIVLNTLDPDRK